MNTPFDEEPTSSKKRGGLFSNLRSSFLTGLIVIAPIAFTIWLLWSFIGWVDGFVLPFVPRSYQPEELLNRWLGRDRNTEEWIVVNIRGVGVVVFLTFTIFVGYLAKGLMGRSLLAYAETLLERVPVVRTIYNAVKQIAETVFTQSERSFEKACLIEYPRKGIWAIGFISTTAKGEIKAKAHTGGELMSIFLPTTPNPTSGFLLFLPKSDVIELDMTVEDAAKLVISAGLVYPNGKDPSKSVEEKLS
ncbi:DUF502 domain-containing protein [Lentibacter algarum]|uniref:DUF502 domain-containing protein n=1 Tax=Lentibacter algarum TaxID=576131 RepID=UPI001C065F84|nr:DUF502 domain-containing protein [Lentibacter algarum]MBU2982367.1 DUF502 domain-containing protein [Lentibacter algarum]